jgi:hypothetical protein
VKVSSS